MVLALIEHGRGELYFLMIHRSYNFLFLLLWLWLKCLIRIYFSMDSYLVGDVWEWFELLGGGNWSLLR